MPRQAIRAQALALGFDAVGFAPAALARRGDAPVSRSFSRAGYHGDMGWLADKAERRGDPQALWPEARTRRRARPELRAAGRSRSPIDPDPSAGDISVYARNRDYHDTIKKRLKALARWIGERFGCGELKVFVDTAPVMEKPLAAGGGHRLAGQAHQSGLARVRLLAVPGRDLHRRSSLAPDAAEERSLRRLPALPRCLPDRGLSRALPARCAALHLLSHHRAQGADRRASCAR